MNEEKDKINPGPLVKRLIEKSKAGKLHWEPTADRQQFVTSIGGDTSFKIRQVTITDLDEWGNPESVDIPILDMFDQKGNLLWQIQTRDIPTGSLRELFEIARRIGNRIDDRIAGAINALDNL
jgi:hypothetical protein